MRNTEQKTFLQNRFSESYSISNFLTHDQVSDLVLYYNQLPDEEKIFKNSGPITANIHNSDRAKDIFAMLKEKVIAEIGSCEIYNAAFFDVSYPHIIHNDDLKSFPDTYKAFTLPLEVRGLENPSFITYNQHYLDGPVKLFKGEEQQITSYYNDIVSDYKNVIGLTSKAFSQDVWAKYLTHIKPAWLEGLSVEKIHSWQPGNAIVFDCARLHSACDFRRQGVTSKLGLSIFTYTQ